MARSSDLIPHSGSGSHSIANQSSAPQAPGRDPTHPPLDDEGDEICIVSKDEYEAYL